MTLIESVPNGWWYTALLPNNIRIVTFFTNFNLRFTQFLKKVDGWKKAINHTEHVKATVGKHDYTVISGPHTIISNSTRLEKAAWDKWMAIGDAAATFDPLSSNGISNAISDGIEASRLITLQLEGYSQAFEHYNEKFISRFSRYLDRRMWHYRMEQRWGNSLFWKQNQRSMQKMVHN